MGEGLFSCAHVCVGEFWVSDWSASLCVWVISKNDECLYDHKGMSRQPHWWVGGTRHTELGSGDWLCDLLCRWISRWKVMEQKEGAWLVYLIFLYLKGYMYVCVWAQVWRPAAGVGLWPSGWHGQMLPSRNPGIQGQQIPDTGWVNIKYLYLFWLLDLYPGQPENRMRCSWWWCSCLHVPDQCGWLCIQDSMYCIVHL